MSKWRWPWSKPEARSVNYSDAVVDHILAQARGGYVAASSGSGARLAAGWIGRSLAGVRLEPVGTAAAFAPTDLLPLARDLILQGQSLWLLREGRWVQAHPQAEIMVAPGRPESWLYRLQIGDKTTLAPGSRVIHVRLAEHPAQPGQGLSPIDNDFGRFAAALESSLMGEAQTSTGYLLGLPQSQTEDFNAMVQKIKGLAGGLFAYERMDKTQPEMREKPIGQDVARLGFDPPTSLESLWAAATGMVMESCGVPAKLILGALEGTAAREALRRCRVTVLEPILQFVARELAKCGQPHQFKFSGEWSNDLGIRARSFAALVKGGMAIEKAAAISGVLNED